MDAIKEPPRWDPNEEKRKDLRRQHKEDLARLRRLRKRATKNKVEPSTYLSDTDPVSLLGDQKQTRTVVLPVRN